ncbi:hypothetical protein HDU79_008327 [Rhizoclosmatium sp. JEL0117]|nr:hypothetical protein HDU79_008327 [Rhizoclosmatium sp. JEL0117]
MDEELFAKSLAADAKIEKLNQTQVEAYIANGTHFIFFGAYYCPYTAEFNPIWLDIQTTYYSQGWNALPNFGIKKIQCGDIEEFCSQPKLGSAEGYPTINLFKDGKFVEEVLSDEIGAIEREAVLLGGKPRAIASASPLATRPKTSAGNDTLSDGNGGIKIIKHTATTAGMDLLSIIPVSIIVTCCSLFLICGLFLRRRMKKSRYQPLSGDANMDAVRYI